MQQFNAIIILLTSFIILNGCTKEQTIPTVTNTAVVEGYLHAGHPVDSIKITQSISYSQADTNLIYLDELEIMIKENDNTFPLYAIGNGIYQNLDLLPEHDKNYELEFTLDGKTISASTYIPEKKEVGISVTSIDMEKVELGSFGNPGSLSLDPIEITWDNEEGNYYYVFIKNIEENPEYINENVLQFQEENGGQLRFVFISEPQITDTYNINARRELTQFGTHQIIVFRVNPEYAALYESSGNSTQSLEEPPTNINNGLGIFTGVSSDTVYLEVNKI